MVDFCYYAKSMEDGTTLAKAMKSKHGCEVAVVKSVRMLDVYFVIPAENSKKWKLKYDKVYDTCKHDCNR